MKAIFRIRYLVFALILMLCAATAKTQVGVVVITAPPPLPVYEQPVCPGEGYIWTPGYWAWTDDGYYWVPGTWVLAPEPGFLWTPGYWAWNGSGFIFNEGFWGPQVGFYGGIDYGFGYPGYGYQGGRWEGGRFFYNRSVNNVNETVVHNVYNTTIVNNTSVPRVSYNGGSGGITARPTPQDEAIGHTRRLPPVAAQTEHVQAAKSNQQLRASINHGRPPIAATPKPGAFHDNAVTPAKEAGAGRNVSGTPSNNPATARTAVHPNELPPMEHAGPPSTGQPKLDQKYQEQQEKLAAKQQEDRQKLQEKQDAEHQQLQRKSPNDATRQQQMEQRHQQQTQQMVEKHTQEQEHLQQKQQPASAGTKGKPPHGG